MRAFAFCMAWLLLAGSVAAQPAPDSDALYDAGTSELEKHDTDAAIAAFTEALKLSPNYFAALRARGRVYFDEMNYDNAIADDNRALALVPDSLWLLLERGGAYAAKGDFDHALADYDRALQLDPRFFPALGSRAGLYGKKKDLKSALADIDHVLQLQPKMPDIISMRGMIYADQDDFPNALADFNQVLDKDTGDHAALVGRCYTQARAGQALDDALEDCERALKQTPGNPSVLEKRGFVYFRMGKFALAKTDYDNAIAAAHFASALYKRGILKSRMGDKAGGQADIAAALTANPHAGDDLTSIGVAL